MSLQMVLFDIHQATAYGLEMELENSFFVDK